MEAIMAIIVFVTFVAMFLITYILNKRTPIPKGVNINDTACSGCKIVSCSKNSEFNK